MATPRAHPLPAVPARPNLASTTPRAAFAQTAALTILVSGGLLWSYWPTLAGMEERWSRDPQYSHGYLVPVFAATLLWARRDLLRAARWQPSLWGAFVLGAGFAMRVLAVAIDFDALDAFSLLVSLAGAVLLVGGAALLRWAWPAIAFLGFMLPLPFIVEVALAQPLRRLATITGTYALQTLGCPAFAEGNIIQIEEVRLGVAEACSGLGMLMTFFALATALALASAAPVWQRLILVVSAAPIAVLANVARIAATGMAYHVWGSDSRAARVIMHDLAGWLMMPLALGLLWLELQYLNCLFVLEPAQRPLPLPPPTPGRPGA